MGCFWADFRSLKTILFSRISDEFYGYLENPFTGLFRGEKSDVVPPQTSVFFLEELKNFKRLSTVKIPKKGSIGIL